MPEFPELYFGSNQPGMKPFPTKESDWKKFDIGFGERLHDLAVGSLTEEQNTIVQALEEETGYAEIARKIFQEGVEANAEFAYRQNLPTIEKKSNKKNPRLSIESIKNIVSRLRRNKSEK